MGREILGVTLLPCPPKNPASNTHHLCVPQLCTALPTVTMSNVVRLVPPPATPRLHPLTVLRYRALRAVYASLALWSVVMPVCQLHPAAVSSRVTCWPLARRCGQTIGAVAFASVMAPPTRCAAVTRRAARLASSAWSRTASWVATLTALGAAKHPVTHTT